MGREDMLRFVRYAILLLVGLALVVAWTAVGWDGSERPGVPAIELSPRERDGGQPPRWTDTEKPERGETRAASIDPGGGAAQGPAAQPAPAGDDDAEDRDEEAGDADDGDDGDDGDD